MSLLIIIIKIIIIIIIIIELYLTRVKHIDYWSPSSFHNGPPTIKIVKHMSVSICLMSVSIATKVLSERIRENYEMAF